MHIALHCTNILYVESAIIKKPIPPIHCSVQLAFVLMCSAVFFRASVRILNSCDVQDEFMCIANYVNVNSMIVQYNVMCVRCEAYYGMRLNLPIFFKDKLINYL